MGKPKFDKGKSKVSYDPCGTSPEEVYPWVANLSQKDKEEFFAELLHAINVALSSGDVENLRETIEAWQETAEVLANKELMAVIKESEEEISIGTTIPCKEAKAKLGTK